MRKCKRCNKNFPYKTKIDGATKNLSSRSYCLECVPWKSGNRFGGSHDSAPGTYKNCLTCGREKTYKGSFCNTCVSRKRRLDTKKKAIELLGGKCNRCGWDKHPAGLEFHHKDDNKEFSVSDNLNKKWDVIKAEVLKCELICSCCHHIHHAGPISRGGEEAKHGGLQTH